MKSEYRTIMFSDEDLYGYEDSEWYIEEVNEIKDDLYLVVLRRDYDE